MDWLGGSGETARRLDGSKRINKTAEIAVTAAVQTVLGGNGNGNGNDNGNVSGRWRKLGLIIAAKRRRRDDSNSGSNGVDTNLILLGGSGWE